MYNLEKLRKLYIDDNMTGRDICKLYGLRLNELMYEFRKAGIFKGKNRPWSKSNRKPSIMATYNKRLEEYWNGTSYE